MVNIMLTREKLNELRQADLYDPDVSTISRERFELIKSLAEIHCSRNEIAHALKIKVSELDELIKSDINLCAAMAYADSLGKMDIRRTQFELMHSGSVDMAKFLGKQYLGQSDKIEQRTELTSGEEGLGITINLVTPDGNHVSSGE